ncbi:MULTISPECIES: ABC transporter ATP-binding protein [unclassified Sedimentibacter]|uniref:ABC transporter ATP-binding protein n=1 Tax=unclassified Sedimentibacter TaxID=2649220 RepID=UPI0027DECA8F|nr:ABC transporter ATP-binding protein [Sedimentibacter sp. MB35-C1]WMJ76027.1 ABC transporter ATP-binding protein [Sedimentibacter sp. MB35-C1]
MKIKLENICKTYESTQVVKDVSMEIEDGEIMVLLGPSGCGKTTLLRMIAGLISRTQGRILFNDVDVSSFPPQKRNTAMVFQNYALFPHLNVEENISFGLKVRKLPTSKINEMVAKIIKSVELEGLEKRKIQELSGGQRQRVALARALVIKPDILLFDEPLSNLDEKLRVSMRQSIKKLQRELGITSIYVTHDQEEAMSIADRITVMNKGEIQQCASPNEIYRNPKNSFVASFVGQANLFNCQVQSDSDKKYINVLNKKINIENDIIGETVTAMIRPEHLHIDKDGIEGVIDFKEELGLITRCQIKIGDMNISLDELNASEHHTLGVGEKIFVSFGENDVVILKEQ